MIDFNEKQRRVLRAQEPGEGASCPPGLQPWTRPLEVNQVYEKPSVAGPGTPSAAELGTDTYEEIKSKVRASAPRNRQGHLCDRLRIWQAPVRGPGHEEGGPSVSSDRDRLCRENGTQDALLLSLRRLSGSEKDSLEDRRPCPAPRGHRGCRAYVKGYERTEQGLGELRTRHHQLILRKAEMERGAPECAAEVEPGSLSERRFKGSERKRQGHRRGSKTSRTSFENHGTGRPSGDSNRSGASRLHQ